jgi:uncharacterized protein YdeI (YjbR/CyaY-like superfamily)
MQDQFTPSSRQDWRNWLAENHQSKDFIWLIYYKKKTGKPTIQYSDAVDEALCFGWIDSKLKSIDDESSMQYFCKRKPKSVWSKVNKAKIERLTAEGLMTEAGFKVIEIAKQNGQWNILDDAEAHIIPEDLDLEFQDFPKAKDYFLALSKTDKRNILQWLVLAKRTETRQARIKEIVSLSLKGQKPKQF